VSDKLLRLAGSDVLSLQLLLPLPLLTLLHMVTVVVEWLLCTPLIPPPLLLLLMLVQLLWLVTLPASAAFNALSLLLLTSSLLPTPAVLLLLLRLPLGHRCNAVSLPCTGCGPAILLEAWPVRTRGKRQRAAAIAAAAAAAVVA
jgi:hypothetical protein